MKENVIKQANLSRGSILFFTIYTPFATANNWILSFCIKKAAKSSVLYCNSIEFFFGKLKSLVWPFQLFLQMNIIKRMRWIYIHWKGKSRAAGTFQNMFRTKLNFYNALATLKYLCLYSSLSNKRAARSYWFLGIFQPAWSYYILHVYWFLEIFWQNWIFHYWF